MSIKDLKNIKIPILPIENLERISNHAIEESSRNELESLKTEIEHWKNRFKKQELINKEQEDFFENRIAKIKEKITTDDLLISIKDGESKKLEFKSTLRLNLYTNKVDRKIENAVLKTITAFCNSEGGDLLIGVEDNGNLLGIEVDKFPNEDKYQLHLNNLISQRIKPLVSNFLDFKVLDVENKRIFKISCKKCNKGVWLNTGGTNSLWEFYIRTGPASIPLSPPDAVNYIHDNLT